jgi:hypothetical protein
MGPTQNSTSTSKTNILKRSVVAIAIQSVFSLEIYQNNFFYFLKIIFETNTSK